MLSMTSTSLMVMNPMKVTLGLLVYIIGGILTPSQGHLKIANG
jgi:hypothetical protein